MNPTQGTTSGVDAFFAKIEKISKIQRILIFSGVFIAIIAIFVFVLYKPKLAEISKLDKQLKTLEKKLKVAKQNAANLEKFQKQMQEAEVQFKTAMRALPEREEIPSLLTSISRSGQDAGLEFLLFQPKSEVRKEFYAEIPVEMSVKGGYHDLAVFFDKVARLSRIVNIRNISMKRAGDTLDLNTSCTAVTYKFVEPPPQKQTNKRKKKKRK
ncbi:MAG: type 4a pilus biogenesis protein PilO [Desulfobacterales bacterium]|nr:type 4a pilus biogenesis protein PilO [Desulfobacterales bacterium]